jgi:hypothetical protein
MMIKLKVGQVWQGYWTRSIYTVTSIVSNKVFATKIKDGINEGEVWLTSTGDDGCDPMFPSSIWNLIDDLSINVREIPDMPLDPSLPVLQAGYLQDRARKKYRDKK